MRTAWPEAGMAPFHGHALRRRTPASCRDPSASAANGTILSRYQEHEVFGLVSIEAATFALGRPMIASAPSLAYRKSLYESVGGFEGIEDSISGDDDLLVRKMQKVPGIGRSPTTLSREACVTTSPRRHLEGNAAATRPLGQQRRPLRGKGIRRPALLRLRFLLVAGPWARSWPRPDGCPGRSMPPRPAAKIVCSGLFLGITSRRLGHSGILRNLVWCEILHVPIVLAAVILGHLGLYRWK